MSMLAKSLMKLRAGQVIIPKGKISSIAFKPPVSPQHPFIPIAFKPPVSSSRNPFINMLLKRPVYTKQPFIPPAFHPPLSQSQSLDGILDTLKEIAAPYVAGAGAKVKSQFKDQLDSAQRKLEDKIGQFLSTGQLLSDIRSRASSQTSSDKPEVKSRAAAIVAKANALLNNYASIKSDAINQIQKLTDLKNQLQTSEVFKFDNPMGMGTRVVELFNQYKSQLGSALSATVGIGTRIENHLSETKKLQNDVSSLESYAQGKGWGATLSSIGGSYMSLTGSLAKIAVVGAMVYFLAPTFISRIRKT